MMTVTTSPAAAGVEWRFEQEEQESPPPPVAAPPPPPTPLPSNLPMTLPTRSDPIPAPKDAYVWVPAILAHIGLETQRDDELARRTGMSMGFNEQQVLEFTFTGVHDVQGQYLCRYVRAVARRLGLRGLKLSGWNALVRNLRDPKDWTVDGGTTLHNVRLFREQQRGGRPLSSGGLCYQERLLADDPSYYRPWGGSGSRPPAPTVTVVERDGEVEISKEVDAGTGGLPGATMQLARLLSDHLQHGGTWHGVDVSPNPCLFEESRRDAEYLDTRDAMNVVQDLCRPANKRKLGSTNAVPPDFREAVVSLKDEGDRLVSMKGNHFSAAAAKYQEAYALHPSSQTLGKMVQHAQEAARSVDTVEAQLQAHGGEVSWDQFVQCWTASTGRSQPQPALPRARDDGLEDTSDVPGSIEDLSNGGMELSSGDVALLPRMPDEDQAGPPVVAAGSTETFANTLPGSPTHVLEASALGPDSAQRDEVEETLSNRLSRTSMEEHSPELHPALSVMEWVVFKEEGGTFRSWTECTLQIVTGIETEPLVRLCERGDVTLSERLIVEHSLAGCKVSPLKDPRNRHGSCSSENSARKLEFEGGDSYKLWAESGGGVWHSARNRELFELIERLAQQVPPLHGVRRRSSTSHSRSSVSSHVDVDSVDAVRSHRHSQGRGMSPTRLRTSSDLQRCRSDSSDRSSYCSATMQSSHSVGMVAPPSLRLSLDDLYRGGWLYKAGRINTAFKKRYFRLESERGRRVLKYYEREPRDGADIEPKGAIDLDAAAAESSNPIVPDDEDEQQFKLHAQGREWHLRWDETCGSSIQSWKHGLLSATRRASLRLSGSR